MRSGGAMSRSSYRPFAGLGGIAVAIAFASFFFARGNAEDRPSDAARLFDGIEVISSPDLAPILDRAVVIDARSWLEHEVIHIARAFHLPARDLRRGDIQTLLDANPGAVLVFYGSDAKSEPAWRAAHLALGWGFQPVHVLDGGVFEWAREAPEETIHFGARLTRETVEEALITDEEHNAVSISAERVAALARTGRYAVYDLRTRQDRAEHSLLIPRLTRVSVERAVRFLDRGIIFPESGMIFIDADGTSTRTLHYWLRHHGKRDFYFLDGGLRGAHEGAPAPAKPAERPSPATPEKAVTDSLPSEAIPSIESSRTAGTPKDVSASAILLPSIELPVTSGWSAIRGEAPNDPGRRGRRGDSPGDL